MSNNTHACSLTTEEISSLITSHAMQIVSGSDTDFRVDRINYLSKRLRDIKAKEAEAKTEGWGSTTTKT